MTTRGGGRADRGRGGRPAHERESTHPSAMCGGDFAPGECAPWFALFRGDFDEWTSDECPFLCRLQKYELWTFLRIFEIFICQSCWLTVSILFFRAGLLLNP